MYHLLPFFFHFVFFSKNKISSILFLFGSKTRGVPLSEDANVIRPDTDGADTKCADTNGDDLNGADPNGADNNDADIHGADRPVVAGRPWLLDARGSSTAVVRQFSSLFVVVGRR